jgi:hypothetical protein
MKKPPDEPKDADRYLPPEVAEERFQEALRIALGAPYKKPQQSPATPPASEPSPKVLAQPIAVIPGD